MRILRFLEKFKSFLKSHFLFLIFTLLYLAFSFLTYKDFGVTYDEKVEYDAGKYLLTYYQTPTSLDYVSNLVNKKPVHIEHRHLPLFSVYSRIYPALVNIFNPNYYFEWFHLQNMLFGWSLFLFSYVLFYLHYKSGKKAILAPLFIAFSPYLLGHIPANPKDIPFATIFLLGALEIYFFRTRKKNELLEILVLGVIFGLAQSQRVVGLTLLMVYFFLGISDFLPFKKHNIQAFFNFCLKSLLIFIVSLIIWIIALPFLGANLPLNFYGLLVNAAGYADWNHEIIYFGEYLRKSERPWHYLFVYLGIKMPLFSLFPLLAGMLLMLKRKLKYQKDHPLVLLTILCLLNFAIYLAIKPVVYNGIRHFLYLVVLVTLISGFFFLDVFKTLNFHICKIVVAVVGIYFMFTAYRMVHLHPYEYIYFNELTGGLKNVSGNFDVDYWGAAYKEAAEYVRDFAVSHEVEDLKVYSCDSKFPVVYYSQFKFGLVDGAEDANIIICDTHKDKLKGFEEIYPLITSINREGVPIFNIRSSLPLN